MVVHTIHRGWCYWKRFQSYKDPNNFATLAAGNAAYFLGAANIPVIRGIAQAVMIANRIFLCIEKQAAIRRHYQSLVLAFKGHYVPRYPATWPMQSKKAYISPSTLVWYKTFGYSVSFRLQRIARCAYLILLDSFQLSMLMIEAAESFSCNPPHNSHHVREFFYHTTSSMDMLVNNREKLLEEINKHKKVVQAILLAMNIPITVDQVIASLSKGLKNAASLNKASKKAQAAFGGLMVDLVKTGLLGFLVGIGLSEFVPDAFITDLIPPWEKAVPPTERYPPKEWVILPSKSPRRGALMQQRLSPLPRVASAPQLTSSLKAPSNALSTSPLRSPPSPLLVSPFETPPKFSALLRGCKLIFSSSKSSTT
ncbi:hypothetical protein [Parachlamydia sp. AcF125]|uniref:hypothetical protein n=1 Tax=Parachlamydia sp. AcF125 TaxID=2795736 RepID=UPI001BC9A2CC|nr:hypothetical protein [Parachlamydia sp. AcF125]